MKPGYTTTEFWVTVVLTLSSIVIAFFGHDWGLASNAQAIAPIAAALATAAYAWSRAHTKTQVAIASSHVNIAKAQAAGPVAEVLAHNEAIAHSEELFGAKNTKADNGEPDSIDSLGFKH